MQVSSDRLIAVLAEVESIMIGRYARKLAMVSQRFDTDDLIQTVAMKAHASIDTCRAENDDELRHWVLQIARYTVESVLTANRACSKRSTMREGCAIGVATDESRDGYQLAAAVVDPATQVEVKEQCQAMLEAIKKLPELQARCLRMKYLDQMEYSEIAAELGSTEDAVRNVVMRAINVARQVMAVESAEPVKASKKVSAPKTVSVEVIESRIDTAVAKLHASIDAENNGAVKNGWPQYYLTRVRTLICELPADRQPAAIERTQFYSLVEMTEAHIGKSVAFKHEFAC